MAVTETIECAQCGVCFTYNRWTVPRMYCSNACKVAACKARNGYKHPAVSKVRYCVCGATLGYRKQLCLKCKEERRRKQGRKSSLLRAIKTHNSDPRPCKECGCSFSPKYGTKRRLFCSSKCGYKHAKRVNRLVYKARQKAVTVEYVDPIKVFDRDGWMCHLCGGLTEKSKRGTRHPFSPELDHIIPLSKGGDHSYKNTACSHRKCNAEKSDKVIGHPSLLMVG